MNSPFFDAISFGHGREFYIVSDRIAPLPGGNLDLFISRKSGRGFELPVPVSELNSPGGEQAPSLRRDGRELFLTSNRAGSDAGSPDIWTAYRQDVGRPWSTPVRVDAPVNTPFIDQQPVLSADGTNMIFTSNRPGGQGGLDLYVTRRERVR
jgi:Tol biopolymer transport system component